MDATTSSSKFATNLIFFRNLNLAGGCPLGGGDLERGDAADDGLLLAEGGDDRLEVLLVGADDAVGGGGGPAGLALLPVAVPRPGC